MSQDEKEEKKTRDGLPLFKDKKGVEYGFKEGIRYTWDGHNNCFVSAPFGTIPLARWEEWNSLCNAQFSGQRWNMVYSDFLKARAYDAFIGGGLEEEIETTIEQKQKQDEMGLLNPGDK
jgi:hypothetical protein